MYVIATTYPYGFGEPFLELELEEIKHAFRHIYLVIPESANLNKQQMNFQMPANASLVELNIKSDFIHKTKSFLKFLNPSIIKEVKNIRQAYRLKFNIRHLRTIMGYLSLGIDFKEKLQAEIKRNKHNPEEVCLYSYWFTYATIGLALMKEENPSFHAVTRVHGWDCFFERNPDNYLPLRPWTINILDRLCPVSETGRQYLLKKLPDIPEEKIKTWYLGTRDGNPEPNQSYQQGLLRLVSIAFISPVKRIKLLIDALSEISEIPVEWTHIGSSPENNNFIPNYAKEKLSKKANIQYKFLGHLSSNDIFKFLSEKHADYLICTSESEGIPVSMMEAAAHGLPIISTNVGGISEIVKHQQNGFLLPAKVSPLEIKEILIQASTLNLTEYQSLSQNSHCIFKEHFNSASNFSKFAVEELDGSLLSLKSEPISFMEYKICSKCIIDNQTYPDIQFDDQGVCNICHTYDELTALHLKEQNEMGEKYLIGYIEKIKKAGKKKEYDCLLGLSGGVDSSYLAVLLKEWGLRPLALHVDNGWNSETAVSNIEKLVKQLDIDLITYVVNWEELRDLELAYMKASVVDIDIPNEMPFQAMLYQTAAKHKFKYIISGHNHASEGWLPPNFTHYKYDTLNLRDIHDKFGKVKLKTYPSLGFFRTLYYTRILNITYFSPLNYLPYNKENAKKILMEKFDWKDYGQKHAENVFTRFYQSYILPKKFHLDKRRSHLSSLICAGQMSREEALKRIELPHYTDPEAERSDREFFIKKLRITEAEFDHYINTPAKQHNDYKSYMNYYAFLRKNFYFLKPLLK